MHPFETLHLVTNMVPTQGGVSFPLECGIFLLVTSRYYVRSKHDNVTVSLTLNLTNACVCTRLTRVKVNNLACIVSAEREFGVRTNARGTLDMHDTNMPATCTRFFI